MQDENFKRYGGEAPMDETVKQPVINGGRGDMAAQAATVVDKLNPSVPVFAQTQSAPIPITTESATKLAAEIHQYIAEARIRAGKVYQQLTGYVHEVDSEVMSETSTSLNGILTSIHNEALKLHTIIHSL